MKICLYGNCNHREPQCKMHRLPADPAKCKRWMVACKLVGSPSKVANALHICRCHFVGGVGPTKQNQTPIALHVRCVDQCCSLLLCRRIYLCRSVCNNMLSTFAAFVSWRWNSTPQSLTESQGHFVTVLYSCEGCCYGTWFIWCWGIKSRL